MDTTSGHMTSHVVVFVTARLSRLSKDEKCSTTDASTRTPANQVAARQKVLADEIVCGGGVFGISDEGFQHLFECVK